MTVSEKQAQLIEDLQIVEDVQERLSAVVSRFARRSLLPAQRINEWKVPGCVSNVWLVPELRDGCCHFAFDADSPMVKGLVGLLCEVYDGGRPEQIAATGPELWSKLGFLKLLSPTRLNGLAAVRARIKTFAEHAAV